MSEQEWRGNAIPQYGPQVWNGPRKQSVQTWRSAWTPHWLLAFSDQFPHPDIEVTIWKNSVGLT